MRIWTRLSLVFTLALASSGALAERAHYLVVKIDDHGQAQPLFHRPVELARPQPAIDLPRAQASKLQAAASDPDKLLAIGTGWSEIVEVPSLLRGEFAANGRSGRIESHVVPAPERIFVLRIPASAGKRITLRHGATSTNLDLGTIAEQAALLAPGRELIEATRPPPAAAPLPDNRLDILILGDGYTAGDEAKFQLDADKFRARMLGLTPFKEYANFVNFVPLFIASSQAGADHPAYSQGCTQASCCADAEAINDPRAGTMADTALDARYCTNQIHRLLTVDAYKATVAASAFPDWDQLMVVVNDDVYGGSGGYIGVFSTNQWSADVAIHEFGHSFHGLADEYTSPYPGFPACSDQPGSLSPCEANATDVTTPASIKWKGWITPGIAIPTLPGTPGVGLFQGARYQASGYYRPANTCMMRELGVPFCPVCAQEYVLQLYRGGNGSPVAGIDLIEPGTESPLPGSVDYEAGTAMTFSATVLRPEPDTVAMQWFLDGQAIDGATGPSHEFRQASSTPATRTLELRAIDTGDLVLSSMSGGLLQHSRTWTIQVGGGKAAIHDFDGDGRSDVFWREVSTGANAIWKSADFTTPQAARAVTDLGWSVAGIGDFNADGRADALWRHAVTGANAIWTSGNAAQPQAIGGVANTAWIVAGVGDFDGDGSDDLFWRHRASGANVIWHAADLNRPGTVVPVGVAWEVAGVGDFDGDGRDDVFWRNGTTGANTIWRSASAATVQKTAGVADLGWRVAGTGDFDSDGRDDVLWRHGTSGGNAIWLSGNAATSRAITGVTNVAWKIEATGDYDGDGAADILWRHAVTGGNVVWRAADAADPLAVMGVRNVDWTVMP